MAELALQTVLRIKTTTCITCGCVIGLQDEYYDERLRDHRNYHCPNGHTQHFTAKSDRELLDEERARHHATLDRLNQAATARDKAELKLKRVKRGVCPECNRTFENLARHMSCKHGAGVHGTIGKKKLP